MCATEDGRRLYVFGGFDGSQLLNDVYYCEAERGIWSPVTVGGQAPEPREGHTAAIIGKYLLVGGTCVMTGAGVSAVGLWGAFGGGGGLGTVPGCFGLLGVVSFGWDPSAWAPSSASAYLPVAPILPWLCCGGLCLGSGIVVAF
jgi:hypothetical protein